MRIVITGGHITPALAVIEKIKDKNDILLIGRKHAFEGEEGLSFEYRIAKSNNIPFEELHAGRLQRKITRYTIPSLLSFPRGMWQSRKILAKYKPDVVLTFGGYLALPVALAARSLGIPLVIHEQTQRVGLANKLVAKFAQKVCISFESSGKYFPADKTILTGNPVREEVFKTYKKFEVPSRLPIIYVTGGSGGSHFINSMIFEILESLLERYVIIHQTGDSRRFNDFEKLELKKNDLPEALKKRYILKKFLYPEEIGWVYKNADIILSRAGINTICELLAHGKMSLLIPLPYGQKGEQLENAELLKRIGIGNFILQKNLAPQKLLSKIQEMIENKKLYEEHRKDAKSYIVPDAAEKILNIVQSVYENYPKKTEVS